MTLARSLPDDPVEWWIYLGVIVFYVLGRWFFAWRQARHDGRSHPARAVWHEDDGPDEVSTPPTTRPAPTGGFASYRQFFGFVGSAAVVLLIVLLTDGPLRVTLMCIVAPVLVLGLSYLDFRKAGKARSAAQS
ncbi:hypothetical protein N4G70_21265 [Streptomyces sp. ASQP_92]|uniref:hypothetical protein n=1 Tax=Streptomyces sp. ASQP_92 TaxID=2979116 RepID=UPI0021BF356B|nr:hypothetical protein [Streptomyces sp. ASQP_92]MCT9091375.1 hypothetical protein [Streptomyces sp. ASQP_92]